ncbi:MAG: zinc ribbon domain-containing protein [Planctomycetota bacterium]
MPTYDYRCSNCGHECEFFQSMKDKPKRKCPACGKNTLERLIGTGAGIIFKGGGFYETDYRSEGYKKAAEADKKAGEGKSSDDGGKKSGDGKSGGEAKKGDGKASDSKTNEKPKKKAG